MKFSRILGRVPYCDECYCKEPTVDSPAAYNLEFDSMDGSVIHLCVKCKIELVTLLTSDRYTLGEPLKQQEPKKEG